jgi:electron transfer flavoprotein alpha subunit
MDKNILILAEVKDGKLRNVSLESLSLAKKLANNGKISAVLIGGDGIEGYAGTLAHHGADQIYVVRGTRFANYSSDGFAQALTQLIDKTQPDAIVMGHTSTGKDLSPKVAARLNLGLISDCVGVHTESGSPEFIRPIYAGKAFEKRNVQEGRVFVTIRPNNFEIGQPDESRPANVEEVQVDIKDLRTVIKDIVRKSSGTIDLTEAKVVVSGGRGVKSEEGFKVLSELAEVLGAAVGASRGACDANYCSYDMQIGQTGKVVTPDLYIACGISGAIQHLAGMSSSKVIVAINKDPEAPIFKVADYGIVGDLFEVVPLLTEEFKKIKG